MGDYRGRGEERLPWLEEATPDEIDARHGFGRMLVVLAGLFLVAVVVTVIVWWFLFRDGGLFGSGQLIRAPEQPYRSKPLDPGGMKVEGTGDLSYVASEGHDVDSRIDLNALPEAPVTDARGTTAAVPAAAPTDGAIVIPPAGEPVKTKIVASAPAKPATPPPAAAGAPAPAAVPPPPPPVSGGTVQLGAFSSQAKAQAAWKSLSGRFQFLGPLAYSILAVTSGDKTLYRLRAVAGGEAASMCQRLKVAGETCTVIG